MKTRSKAIWILIMVMFGAFASNYAMAQHRGHGVSRGHGYGGHARIGISVGVPLFATGYYYSPYYAYPAYVYRPPVYVYPSADYRTYAPTEYVERSVVQVPQVQSLAPASGDWYYCAASSAYYPYVKECPSGWQRVPAQPPNR